MDQIKMLPALSAYGGPLSSRILCRVDQAALRISICNGETQVQRNTLYNRLHIDGYGDNGSRDCRTRRTYVGVFLVTLPTIDAYHVCCC